MPPSPVNTETRLATLARWRTVLAILAVVVPTALFSLIERQARRLDALAAHGQAIEATVTGVSRDGNTADYAYRVGGHEYTWSAGRVEAPFAVGRTFSVTYLPDDPSLSRPIPDRRLASVEAAKNRRIAWKACAGIGLVLLVLAALAQRDLRRLRAGAPSAARDPREYRRSLKLRALALLPFLVAIGAYGVDDARARGESIIPGLSALLLLGALLGGVFYYAGRAGPARAQVQSRRALRWLAPLALGVALLRLIAFLVASR